MTFLSEIGRKLSLSLAKLLRFSLDISLIASFHDQEPVKPEPADWLSFTDVGDFVGLKLTAFPITKPSILIVGLLVENVVDLLVVVVVRVVVVVLLVVVLLVVVVLLDVVVLRVVVVLGLVVLRVVGLNLRGVVDFSSSEKF